MPRAVLERRAIFQYWNKRNDSKRYSNKLYNLFRGAALKLIEKPDLGKLLSATNVRYIIVEKYLLVYRIKPEAIEIISVWDGRRNPDDFEKLITKR